MLGVYRCALHIDLATCSLNKPLVKVIILTFKLFTAPAIYFVTQVRNLVLLNQTPWAWMFPQEFDTSEKNPN